MAHNTKLNFLVLLLLTLTTVAMAAPPGGGSLSGTVKDSGGRPQMGAAVEVFTSAVAQPLHAFTDAKGFYRVEGLLPGTYFVKATATQFLPSLRENVIVKAGSHVLVNLTLSTLTEAFQMLPARKVSEQNDDDWRWTLRSASNRPILRVLDDDSPLVIVSRSEDNNDRALKARVAFVAGGGGDSFTSSNVKTHFNVEQSWFGSGKMSFSGNVGTSASGIANGAIRASYQQLLPNGSSPEIAITAHRFTMPETALHHAALNALAVTLSDNFNVGQFLEFNYGGELQSLQFRGRVNAFRPFGSVTAHFGPDTTLEYGYATSVPTTRSFKGFDTMPNDLSETNPRVSLRDGLAQVEKARHQEVAVSRRFGKTKLQAAYFDDSLANPAVTGVGNGNLDALDSDGNILPDVYSNTFTYTGENFHSNGFRVVAQRELSKDFTATVNYSLGGTLVAQPDSLLASASRDIFRAEKRHAVTAKLAGTVPVTKTKFITSYKWTSGSRALTPVDMFNRSAGQSDPFLNIFVRQPIPGTAFFNTSKVEALIDVRNLLAQGYVPMVGNDGRTLYLVQSARSIRGGLAFSF